jgi:hypothetical protein
MSKRGYFWPAPWQAKHFPNPLPAQNEHLKPLLSPEPLQNVQAKAPVPLPLQSEHGLGPLG